METVIAHPVMKGGRAKRLVLALAVFVLFHCAVMLGQASSKMKSAGGSTVATVTKYCAGVEAFEKAHDHEGRLFANIGTAENSTDEWREVPNKKELDKLEHDDEALVWFQDGNLVAANIAFSSGSGDWVNSANYCFRADHTLARIHSVLNTFEGGVHLVRESIYDSNGSVVRSSSQLFDLETKKPIKGEHSFMDVPTPVFLKTADLPFFSVLQRKKR